MYPWCEGVDNIITNGNAKRVRNAVPLFVAVMLCSDVWFSKEPWKKFWRVVVVHGNIAEVNRCSGLILNFSTSFNTVSFRKLFINTEFWVKSFCHYSVGLLEIDSGRGFPHIYRDLVTWIFEIANFRSSGLFLVV